MWQGTGCGLDPLRVTVPTLTGDDLQPGGELALFDPPLLEGDRVWCCPSRAAGTTSPVIARRA